MPSFAGARAKLKTATQDLFRLSGGNSIPVEARPLSEPVAPAAKAPEKPVDELPASARKPEASIMFSLQELMKANPISARQEDEAPDQLWNMQAATPLFGTAHDQALLTTPLKKEPSSSMDSMTMSSRPPLARRWLPVGLAIASSCMAVAAAGWWFTGMSAAEPALAVAVNEASAAAPAPPAAASPPPAVSAPEPAPSPEPAPAAPEPAEAEAEAEAASPAPSAQQDEKEKARKTVARARPRSTRKKSAPAFDKAAARAALGAAAVKARACRKGGPAGKGKVQLTFTTSGKVSSASIVEGPFAGQAAGACALQHFRAARIPAFSGSAVTVAKSFSIR